MSSYRRDNKEFRARMGELSDPVMPVPAKHTGREPIEDSIMRVNCPKLLASVAVSGLLWAIIIAGIGRMAAPIVQCLSRLPH